METKKIKKSLEEKLNSPSISKKTLKEGIKECFILTNRKFLRHRMGENTPIDEIDSVTIELVDQIIEENAVTPKNPSLSALRKSCEVLDKQLRFEAIPELLQHHDKIINRLFELVA